MMRRQSVQIHEQVVTYCVTPNGGMYRLGPSILFIYSVSRSVLKNLWELCGRPSPFRATCLEPKQVPVESSKPTRN